MAVKLKNSATKGDCKPSRPADLGTRSAFMEIIGEKITSAVSRCRHHQPSDQLPITGIGLGCLIGTRKKTIAAG